MRFLFVPRRAYSFKHVTFEHTTTGLLSWQVHCSLAFIHLLCLMVALR